MHLHPYYQNRLEESSSSSFIVIGAIILAFIVTAFIK